MTAASCVGRSFDGFIRALRATPLGPTADRGFPIHRMGPRPRLEGKSTSLVLVEPHFKRVIKVPASQSHKANGTFCYIISAIN